MSTHTHTQARTHARTHAHTHTHTHTHTQLWLINRNYNKCKCTPGRDGLVDTIDTLLKDYTGENVKVLNLLLKSF